MWSLIPRDWFAVMNDAKAKENISTIIKAHLKPFDKDIIDKENAWDEREWNLFKIQIEKKAIAMYDLIELKWFDFTTLKQTQVDCIVHQMRYSNY